MDGDAAVDGGHHPLEAPNPTTHPNIPILPPTHASVDLSLIEARVKEQDYYRSREMLLADLLRMCRNCKAYNTPETEYYACVGAPFFRMRACLPATHTYWCWWTCQY